MVTPGSAASYPSRSVHSRPAVASARENPSRRRYRRPAWATSPIPKIGRPGTTTTKKSLSACSVLSQSMTDGLRARSFSTAFGFRAKSGTSATSTVCGGRSTTSTAGGCDLGFGLFRSP